MKGARRVPSRLLLRAIGACRWGAKQAKVATMTRHLQPNAFSIVAWASALACVSCSLDASPSGSSQTAPIPLVLVSDTGELVCWPAIDRARTPIAHLCSKSRYLGPADPIVIELELNPWVRFLSDDSAGIDLRATLASLVVSVNRFDQEPTHHLVRVPRHGLVWDLVFTVSAMGLETGNVTLAWNGPAPQLGPGWLAISLSGSIHQLDGEQLDFVTNPVEIDIAPDSLSRLAISDLEHRAKGKITEVLDLHGKHPNKLEPCRYEGETRDGLRRVVCQGEHQGSYMWAQFVGLFHESGRLVRVDSGTKSGCVAAGTTVVTPQGNRLVERLRVGDVLLGYDVIAQENRWVQLEALRTNKAVRLTMINDRLSLTPEHPVWADGAWRPAGEITSAARLRLETGEAFPATLQTRAADHTKVFDLQVSSPHTFFASGILVHNKRFGHPAPTNLACDAKMPDCGDETGAR